MKLTIRYIKSLEHSIVKYVVMDNIDESMTISELKVRCLEELASNPALKRFNNVEFDSFKIYHIPGSNKSSNRIINTDHDEFILKNEALTLKEANVGDEYELSFFNKKDYCKFLRE